MDKYFKKLEELHKKYDRINKESKRIIKQAKRRENEIIKNYNKLPFWKKLFKNKPNYKIMEIWRAAENKIKHINDK